MNNLSNTCSIKVPTVIYVNYDEINQNNNFNYIILSIKTLAINNCYSSQKYLQLDEALQIKTWLIDSITYIETLDGTENDIIMHSYNPFIKVIDYSQLNEDRLKLIGQLIIETKKETQPCIVIDVVTKFKKVWVRLTAIGELILACWFSLKAVRDLINGFSSAILYLSQNPPRIVSNLHIGKVEAISSDGQSYWINIELEGAVTQKDNTSNIVIDIVERQEAKGFSSMWWIDNIEASKLSKFLAQSSIAAKKHSLFNLTASVIGTLEQCEASPWLIVKVEKIPTTLFRDNYPNSLWVNLTFDDELVKENSEDSKFWLTHNSAEQLSHLLSTAIKNKAIFAPNIYLVSQVDNYVVFELNF